MLRCDQSLSRTNHAVPYGTGLLGHVFQALRAWLTFFQSLRDGLQPAKRDASLTLQALNFLSKQNFFVALLAGDSLVSRLWATYGRT